jgi:putative transposase
MAQLEDMRLPAGAREALVNDPDFLRQLVEAALNRFLDAEISEHLQAGPYERSDARTGYRNGYRARQLKTRVGTISLAVPMDRDGTFRSELFDRYQRSEKALVGTLMEMYLEGVSTRKVRDVTEALCGTSFSKSTVSRLVGSLDTDLKSWRERRLEVAYPYLIVDARYEHVRVNGQVVSQGVLVVKGVREDGLRELLAVEVADTENEVTYEDLFRRLKDRGLTGVQLVTSDDHRGLVNAIGKHFQGVSWQRCQVHIVRNALGKVARSHRAALAADIKAVFNAPTLAWARTLKGEVITRWARTHPKLAEWLETALEDALACFAFPEAHRRRIRSTNGLERFNQELKRRTRVVRIFPNPEACLRLVTALCVEQSEEWLASRVYLDMRKLDVAADDQAPQAAVGEEEVKSMAA